MSPRYDSTPFLARKGKAAHLGRTGDGRQSFTDLLQIGYHVVLAMKNTEIAAVFREVAGLLEKKKDNWFKIRAYRRAADSIEGQPVAVEKLVAEGRLREIPGVGEAVAKKVTELVTTGRLEYYERLRAELAEDGR